MSERIIANLSFERCNMEVVWIIVGVVIGFSFSSFAKVFKCEDCRAYMAYERFKHDTGNDGGDDDA